MENDIKNQLGHAKYNGNIASYTIEMLDDLDGHEFEYAVADLLRGNGYRNVSVTPGSRDFSGDVLAERLTNHKVFKYIFQCKRYNSPVGLSAVNEALGAAGTYHADIAAVITTSTFRPSAITQATNNGVRLFDRSNIIRMLGDYDPELAEHSKNTVIERKGSTRGTFQNQGIHLINMTWPQM